MNIEVLLTESEIAVEFAEALEARDVPEKFFYWSPLSVKRWRETATPGPKIGDVALLAEGFGDHVPVVSFGAGEGAQDRALLADLRALGKTVRYFPVDASQALLEIACSAAEDAEFEASGIKADISSRMHILLAADAAEAPRLFLMTGNTLGGFDPFDQLANIAEAMRPGDRLVIDGSLHSEEAVSRCMADDSRDFAFAPLASVGLTEEDGRVRFDAKRDDRHAGLHMVTRYFQAERDLRFCVLENDIHMARGERMFMNFRYLFTAPAFLWLLQNRGKLKVVSHSTSPDGRILTAVCSK